MTKKQLRKGGGVSEAEGAASGLEETAGATCTREEEKGREEKQRGK